MGLKKNNPGCGCCESCEIFTDSFSRPDAGAPGADWLERSGTWEVVSENLVTIDSNAIVEPVFAHPDGLASVVISADVIGTSFSDSLRMIVDYQDANNYLCAELKVHPFGYTSLKLISRVGGSDIELKSTLVIAITGSQHKLQVCLGGGMLACQLATAANDLYCLATPATGSSARVALGTGTMIGTALFDNFTFHRHQSENTACPTCVGECVPCCDEVQLEYIVDLGAGGLTNLDCERCVDIAGEYSVGPFSRSLAGVCTWEYREEDFCSSADECQGVGGCSDLSDLILTLLLINTGSPSSPSCIWRLEVAIVVAVDASCPSTCTDKSNGLAVFESGTIQSCTANLAALSKVHENWNTCDGSLPDEVFLWQ